MFLAFLAKYREAGLLLLRVSLGIAFIIYAAPALMGGPKAWAQFGHLINVKRFFQVTGIFLLLFMAQVAVYTLHEFAEAGLLPNSEALHTATEKFSADGLYGRWFSVVMVGICAVWLLAAWVIDRLRVAHQSSARFGEV